MKLQVTKLHVTIGVIAALILAVVFSACEVEIIDTGPKAELLSLKIVVPSGDMDIQKANIPSPVSNVDWNDEDYDLYGANFKTIAFKRDNDIEDIWFEPKVSRGAKVKWGVANRTVRPNKFEDTRVFAEINRSDFIYFQITSEDNAITNYYRFSTYISSPVKELSSISVAGREADMNIVAPSEKWNGDTLAIGGLHITQANAARTVIDAVPWAATSKLRYAKTPYASSVSDRVEPVFGTSNTLSFGDGEFLYVEVTAENTLDKNFYLFRVYVGRIGTIGKLTFINPARASEEDKGTYEALGKGTADNIWTRNTGAGSFDSPHQPSDGFTFAVELDEVQGTWQYAKMNGLPNSSTQPTWLDPPGGKTGTPKLRLENNEYLAIKVIPPNRVGSTPDYFYKVKIGLLAAEFLVQPKSHAYKVNTSADPLTFTLDRTIPNATYQWYEANSWYGGYGFDSEGRIGEKNPTVQGGLVAEAGWGDEDSGTINGIAYDVKQWHQKGLDEKDNVSLHNGGNQYYNLPTPGRPIPAAKGGTSPSYTPPISSAAALGSGENRRPFITGFSNETHYYWVVVTDPATSLKTTSRRAVIVTEWGEKYHNGQPTGELVDKEHYIIDLYAYQTKSDPNSYGLQEPPRNISPFKAGNHGDKYLIPVTFPPDFDIMDYSVFTAQALFFLADGREWIQNWTQGDIGFARTKEGGIKGNLDDAEEIVLWYNLTNDNATRGLASSGNEGLSGAGSGLTETPEYIVVKPAGTKPLNQMPPFADGQDGRPLTVDSVGRIQPHKNDNAQGWFTPYIELCEVRFEGPAR